MRLSSSTMRKVRRLAAVVAIAVAAGAIGLWLARDQPRRRVQAALAGRLGAEVSVGSLHFDSLSAVRLGRVVIRMHAAPGMREVRIAEIQAFGPLREMAAGRFQAMRLAGLEVVLDPAAGAVWPTTFDAATLAEFGRLDIADGRLTIVSPGGDSVVDFAAHLRDVGRAGRHRDLHRRPCSARSAAPPGRDCGTRRGAASLRGGPLRRAPSGRERTAVRASGAGRSDFGGGSGAGGRWRGSRALPPRRRRVSSTSRWCRHCRRLARPGSRLRSQHRHGGWRRCRSC